MKCDCRQVRGLLASTIGDEVIRHLTGLLGADV